MFTPKRLSAHSDHNIIIHKFLYVTVDFDNHKYSYELAILQYLLSTIIMVL